MITIQPFAQPASAESSGNIVSVRKSNSTFGIPCAFAFADILFGNRTVSHQVVTDRATAKETEAYRASDDSLAGSKMSDCISDVVRRIRRSCLLLGRSLRWR